MGRTKGSLNRKKGDRVIVKKYRKRGRPKKEVVKKETYDISKVKKYKFLGYCKCEFVISEKELINKNTYLCPNCDREISIKKLLKEVIKERPLNKKEYLSQTIHSAHYESLPLDDVSLGPKDLKIQE